MKKRILSILLAAVMIFSLLPVAAWATGAEWTDKPNTVTGSGTEETPYLIGTLSDLTALATAVNGGTSFADTYFKLTADIGSESGDELTTSIGSSSHAFAGHFDGAGHTVWLNITASADAAGLFGQLAAGGEIKGVVTAGAVSGSGNDIGGVCGVNFGTIRNCKNGATVSGNSSIGGICGRNGSGYVYDGDGGVIVNCVNTAMVSGQATVGGVCGFSTHDCKIYNSYNSGNVSATTADGLGGVCGKNTGKNAAVINCYSSGKVSQTNSGTTIGGVCGSHVSYDNAVIKNCYYNSDINNGQNNTPSNAVSGYGSTTDVSGLSTENMKKASGSDSLIDKLNGYIAKNNSATGNWAPWELGVDGYPTLHVHEFMKAWSVDNALPTTAGSYYLTADVTLTPDGTNKYGWGVPAGDSTTPAVTNLCLNGHVIKLAESTTGSVIKVPQYATLNLYDCDTTTEHYFTVDEDGLWTLDESGTETVTGGVITGGTNVGVFVEGVFNMHGGTICGNSAQDGGGVFVKENGGTFNMSGGTICGNTAANCGGGVNDRGTFNMSGGVIEYNKANHTGSSDCFGGGGVAIYQNGAGALSGGVIQHNSSTVHGGGVLILQINEQTGNPQVSMTGVSIMNNTAVTGGGGVYFDNSCVTVTLGGDTIIKDNVLSSGAVNNFHFDNTRSKPLTLGTGDDAPKTGMSVGVTTGSSVPVAFTTNGAADYTAYFFSDNPVYAVQYVNDHLELVKSWTALKNALNGTPTAAVPGLFNVEQTNNPTGYKITLLTDFKAESSDTTLSVSGTKTLDLNGHVINADGKVGSVITVPSGATLTLTDSGTTVHYFTKTDIGNGAFDNNWAADSTSGYWTLATSQSTPTEYSVTGGCITGGNMTSGSSTGQNVYGAGVLVSGGNFTMSGGNIVGNYGLQVQYGRAHGAGVGITAGSFTMNGGRIVGNVINGGSSSGGGIYISGGTFNMNGGTIDQNYAGWGGGICAGGGTNVIITDGIIEKNHACFGGGGVSNGGTFKMSGGTIRDNHAGYAGSSGGGGINADGTVTLAGTAKILNNSAVGSGGGVGAGANLTIGGSVQITGNTGGCSKSGGTLTGGTTQNLYLPTGTTVALGTETDAPLNGMSVGVTTGTTLGAGGSVNITSNCTEEDAKYFFSDGSACYVDFASPALMLKKPAADSFAINVIPSENGAVTASAKETVQDGTITLTVTPNSGYQLKSLKYNDGTNHDITSDKSFTMPAANVTVTAEFEAIPAPPSGGGGTPTVTVPVSGDKDSVKVQATVSGSNATVKNVTSEQLDKVGTGENVTIDLSGLNKSVSGVTIPKTTLENVAESEASGLEIKLPNGTAAVFDSATVAAVAEQAAGSNIQLVVDKESKAEQALTAAQKETVKALNDALVLDAYFVSGGRRISDFKGGEAELTVSYPTTKPVRVWYVAEDGSKTLVPSTFDGKAAKFVVKHFSHYAIELLDGSSYATCPKDATCPISKFTDTKADFWWHDGIHYCIENGLMSGIGNDQFAPNATLTRGMVVTVLARLNGVETVKGNSWYVPGQEWAVANGISDGTNMTSAVTREQLATMLYRYAQFKGVDTGKFTENTNTLSYEDVFTIREWAAPGMHFCIAAGVVNGDNYGNLNPRSTATRAEAATMFQRFCENVTK